MGMTKVSLILDTISYAGDSVGRDWTFKINGASSGQGFESEYRSGVAPGKTIKPGAVIKEFHVDEADAVALSLDVKATERDKKHSDTGRGSVALADDAPGTVKVNVRENNGPDSNSDSVAALALSFRLVSELVQGLCPSNIPKNLPEVKALKILPLSSILPGTAGGTDVDPKKYQLTLCPYQEKRKWKAKISLAYAQIDWNVAPSRFQEPIYPPNSGANVSCNNIESVVAYLFYAYKSGVPTIDTNNPNMLPYYTLKAAETHEGSHIKDAEKYIVDVFKKIQKRISKEMLGSALDTSLSQVQAKLKTLESQALADWSRDVEALRQSNKAKNEKTAQNKGKPDIKPALDAALAYAKNTCGKKITLPKA